MADAAKVPSGHKPCPLGWMSMPGLSARAKTRPPLSAWKKGSPCGSHKSFRQNLVGWSKWHAGNGMGAVSADKALGTDLRGVGRAPMHPEHVEGNDTRRWQLFSHCPPLKPTGTAQQDWNTLNGHSSFSVQAPSSSKRERSQERAETGRKCLAGSRPRPPEPIASPTMSMQAFSFGTRLSRSTLVNRAVARTLICPRTLILADKGPLVM
ncbi:hypothetical protein VUR80DRAFT_8910 [Thermomyces stellatus]